MNWKQITAVVLALACQLDACVEPWNEISLSGGWRNDRLETKVDATDIEKGKRVTFLTDDLKITDINVWEIGGNLHWSVPNVSCFCDNDYGWLNRFYIRGYYYYGWITDGHYHEVARETATGASITTKAKTHKGRTLDGSIGLGFLYPVCDDFALGPVGGWAYDQIRTHNHQAKTNGAFDPILNGVKYTSTWKSPWVGFDLTYNWCTCTCMQIRFDGGYEYHWGHWKGSWTLKGPDQLPCGAFSDHRHAHEAHGNVVWGEATWNMCDCWDLGLGFKWQSWRSNGREKPRAGSFTALGCPDTHEIDKIKSNKWRSIAVTVDIGYEF